MEIWESQKDWGAIMRRIIIAIEIIAIILLLAAIPEKEAGAVKEVETEYFLMNVTFYSLDRTCISDKWNDGKTATNTDVRKGVVAINVDMINGKWAVVSPLSLGDRIYIEGLGEFSVEDTGRFSERDNVQDIYTVDVFEPDHQKAIKGGRQVRKVFIING